MSEIVVGNIMEGKVNKITSFGAIIALDDGGQGLVHISQIANSFVQDINDHLKVDDKVKVKVMSIDPETKRIALSIRAALPAPEKPKFSKPKEQFDRNNSSKEASPKPETNDFEDKMKDFLKQSNDKMATLNKRINKR